MGALASDPRESRRPARLSWCRTRARGQLPARSRSDEDDRSNWRELARAENRVHAVPAVQGGRDARVKRRCWHIIGHSNFGPAFARAGFNGCKQRSVFECRRGGDRGGLLRGAQARARGQREPTEHEPAGKGLDLLLCQPAHLPACPLACLPTCQGAVPGLLQAQVYTCCGRGRLQSPSRPRRARASRPRRRHHPLGSRSRVCGTRSRRLETRYRAGKEHPPAAEAGHPWR